MGPGAGTAVLGGVGLGFANAVSTGPVGVVAAAGTGAQEVMTLLDRWGIGVSAVIGVGGRDLSAGVGGLMARDAVQALDADPGTQVILLVSKPPDENVAQMVIGASHGTPVVAACLGMSAPDGLLAGAPLEATLEGGARRVAAILGRPEPDPDGSLDEMTARATERMSPRRSAVRGFFTGGTLCYEAQVILGESLGPVYSNIPLRPGFGLPAPGRCAHLPGPRRGGVHQRPAHPMIDPAARKETMQAEAFGPDIAAVLLDVVIGYGSHPDPAGEIAGTCADIVASGAAVVCYVLGARADPQGFDRQRTVLAEAGAIVTASAAQAARVASAIAARQAARPPRCAREAPGQAPPDQPAGARGPGDLLRQATRRGGPHAGAGRGAARGRVPGAGDRARRPRGGLLPSGPGAVHHHRGSAQPADAGRTRLRQRGRAGQRPGRLAADYPILHTQDCISARAACRVRDTAGGAVVIRTVHHVDDFTSPSLIDCQRQAILEPDRVLVVSQQWQGILAEEYGTAAEVVHNGVDVTRFQAPDAALAAALRQRAAAAGRPLILAVGGIEPRKGSDTLIQAIASLRRSGRRQVLAVVGGHSFQDYREYRDRVLSSLPRLGLRLDDDVVLLGTVPDAELPGWYAAADVLAFPSTKEGWGLAVLEAMSAGLPVVVSDLPVFREYLRPGRDAAAWCR